MNYPQLTFPIKRRVYGVFQLHYKDYDVATYRKASLEKMQENLSLKETSSMDDLYHRKIEPLPPLGEFIPLNVWDTMI